MPEEPLVYTVKEFADLVKIGPTTAYTLIRTTRVRAIRLHGNWGGLRIPADSVKEFLTPAPPSLPAPGANSAAKRSKLVSPGLILSVPPGMRRGPNGEPLKQ